MPGLARVRDRDKCHCSVPFRKGHFADVTANGRGLSCRGHKNTTHLKPCGCPPCCCGHSAAILRGSPNVFAHNTPVGRIGDPVGPMCTSVAQGSRDVFAN